MIKFTAYEMKALMNSGHSESEILQALSEAQSHPMEKVSSLEELRALGLDTKSDLVITFGPRRHPK